MTIEAIKQQIIHDVENKEYTKKGILPLFQANAAAKVLIIGQAPGQKAQDNEKLFADRSGERLREWLGIDEATFYDATKIAILPMDFYFPGKGKSGDLPPRKNFAEKWHPLFLKELTEVELTLLIGRYAMSCYLGIKTNQSITPIIQNFADYLPAYLPLVHPSPRNQLWMNKHPWFAAEVLPILKKRIAELI